MNRSFDANLVRRAGRWLWLPTSLSVSVIVIALLVSSFGTNVMERLAITMFINMIIVVSLYMFTGNSGVFQFGHMAFMGLGAYAAVLFTIPTAQKMTLYPDLPGFLAWTRSVEFGLTPAVLIGGGVAALVALTLSPALMRLTGAHAGIATFAVLVIVNAFLLHTDSITRGSSTVVGVPRYTTMATVVIWTVIAIAVGYVLQESKHGLRLRASREDLRAAKAVGIHISRERALAFVIHGFFMGVAGVLWAHFFTVFGPDAFFLPLTFLTVAMLVVGGINSLTGAVTGVIFLTAVAEFLRRIEIEGLGPIPQGEFPGMTELLLALIMLVILILRPSGITGGKEIAFPNLSKLRGSDRARRLAKLGVRS